MDSELEIGRGRVKGSESKSLTAIFTEMEPLYLTYGMTDDQYWNGDNELVVAYRIAFQNQRDVRNYDMWLQGRYFYDALCAVAPIFRALSKAKKPLDYTERPYPLTEEQVEMIKREEEKKKYDMMMAQMKAYAAEINKKFEKGGKG